MRNSRVRRIVKPGFGVRVFHEFSLINFVGVSYCRSAMQKRTLAPYVTVDAHIAEIH